MYIYVSLEVKEEFVVFVSSGSRLVIHVAPELSFKLPELNLLNTPPQITLLYRDAMKRELPLYPLKKKKIFQSIPLRLK